MQHNITHGILKAASFNHSGGTHDQLVHLFFPKKNKSIPNKMKINETCSKRQKRKVDRHIKTNAKPFDGRDELKICQSLNSH